MIAHVAVDILDEKVEFWALCYLVLQRSLVHFAAVVLVPRLPSSEAQHSEDE